MGVIEFLQFLGGAVGVGAVAALSSLVLEKLPSFQAMSSDAKKMVSIAVALLVGLLGTGAAAFLTAFPDVLKAILPYWPTVYLAASLIVQQLTHSTNRAESAKGG